MEYQPPLIIECSGTINDVEHSWNRSLTRMNGRMTIKDARVLGEHGKALQEKMRRSDESEYNTHLPILGYYGTGRLWNEVPWSLDKKSFLGQSRSAGYHNCMNPNSNFKEFSLWYSQLEYKVLQELHRQFEGVEGSVYKAVKEAVQEAITKCLRLVEWHSLQYDMALERIVAFHDDLGRMKVEDLSDGIRSVLSMAADIAFRCCKLNSWCGKKAPLETSGVVLIDEVDMHLHPEWQQTVLQSFCEAFLNIQFIMTTHSPQVLSTVSKESVRVLKYEWDKGKQKITCQTPIYQTKGVASSDVLAQIMGIDPIPQIREAQQLSMYKQLIRNCHLFKEAIS